MTECNQVYVHFLFSTQAVDAKADGSTLQGELKTAREQTKAGSEKEEKLSEEIERLKRFHDEEILKLSKEHQQKVLKKSRINCVTIVLIIEKSFLEKFSLSFHDFWNLTSLKLIDEINSFSLSFFLCIEMLLFVLSLLIYLFIHLFFYFRHCSCWVWKRRKMLIRQAEMQHLRRS